MLYITARQVMQRVTGGILGNLGLESKAIEMRELETSQGKFNVMMFSLMKKKGHKNVCTIILEKIESQS